MGVCLRPRLLRCASVSLERDQRYLLIKRIYVDATRPQEQDPSPFSNVLHSYLNRVHRLLGSDSFPGLTNGQLSIFKSTYGPTAFVCRFFGCTNSTTGFANDQLRRQHELIHTPPLICNNSSCTYGLSFGSLEALKRHMRENHEDTLTIPRSVRLRSVKLSSTALENGVSTQPASSAADPDTYTCVYRDCALRFETLRELQKHHRDKHRRNLNSLSNESGHMISSSPSQSQSHERDSISRTPHLSPDKGMETSLRASDMLLQIVEREKQTIRQNHPHLSEQELQQFVNQEMARFSSLINNDHASQQHPQNFHVPRSMSYNASSSSQHAIV